MPPAGRIPNATVARLPRYLRSLDEYPVGGLATVSSDELADLSGVSAANLRKDLSHLGTYGTRGVGYDVDFLRFAISQALGVANTWRVMICGMGNLGQALASHPGFSERGFPVVAATDTDPDKIGTEINGIPVFAPSGLDVLVVEYDITIAVIATPPAAAQGAVDRAVTAGVRSIMNFAPTVVAVPDGVEVRSVDFGAELQILGFHLHQRRLADDPTARPGA